MKIGNIIKGWALLTAKEMGLIEQSEQAKLRLKECSDCIKDESWKCPSCGCHMPAKVLVSDEKCPIGKW